MSGISDTSTPFTGTRAKPERGLDIWLIVATVILLVIGLMSLYSIDATTDGAAHFSKQMFRLAVGFVPFAFFLVVSPKFLFKYAWLLYGLNVTLLALVLLVGKRSGGAQRWVAFGPLEFQPSELAKLLVVITLAAFLTARKDSIRSPWTFLLSLAHIAIPLALVFSQPHLGATLVVLVSWLGVSLAAGVPTRYISAAVIAAVLVGAVALTVPGVLREYQKERVRAMFGGDPQGNKFQTDRSLISFGVGGLTGVGFLQGEHKRMGFVPKQETDFIFTVVGEEGGFVGCLLVLAAYAFFFFRVWHVMFRAEEPFFRMIAAGIFSYLAFHTVVNLGMTLGLLPVVGLWLPFMSFGGTAIWLCLASVGMLLNIRSRERPVLF